MIPLGEWLPDLPAFENPGLVTAQNCIYYGGAYRPYGSPVNVLAALPAACTGFIFVVNNSGVVQGFAGTTTDLYELVASAWTSRGSGFTGAVWKFAQFGGTLIAVSAGNPVQALTLGGTGNFAAVTGTYQAKLCTVVRDFVVLGNMYDSTGNEPQQVNWSGINAPTSYAASAATQAGSQIMAGSYGPISGVVGGDYGVIFQQQAIWRMDYVGSPLIFQFTLVELNKGTLLPGSVIQAGNVPGGGRRIFYIGVDGIYSFDGQTSTPLGVNRWNQTVLNDIDMNYTDSVSATIDYNNDMVLWLYAGAGNTDGVPNRLLAYNYIEDKATLMDVDGEVMGMYLPLTSSMDTLAFDMDTANYDMDANALTSLYPQPVMSNTSHEISQFNGPALAASFKSGDFQIITGKTKDYMRLMTGQAQLVPGKRALMTGLRLYTDGSPTITVGGKNAPLDAFAYRTAGSASSSGIYPIRYDSRYFNLELDFAAGATWSQLQGLEIRGVETSYT